MRCYLLALAVDSSLDKYSNNWSMYKLIEEVGVKEYPVNLPFHLHMYFELDEDEVGVEYEFRVVGTRGGEEVAVGNVFAQQFDSERMRLRARGFTVPKPGDYGIEVEWRRSGSDEAWVRGQPRWPLEAKREEDASPDNGPVE